MYTMHVSAPKFYCFLADSLVGSRALKNSGAIKISNQKCQSISCSIQNAAKGIISLAKMQKRAVHCVLGCTAHHSRDTRLSGFCFASFRKNFIFIALRLWSIPFRIRSWVSLLFVKMAKTFLSKEMEISSELIYA